VNEGLSAHGIALYPYTERVRPAEHFAFTPRLAQNALGQIVEHTGLSVQEARSAIEQYEAAAARTAALAAPTSVDALTARLLAAQTRGTLAQRVREVVLENQAKAATPIA
jgi:hypothetical protein